MKLKVHLACGGTGGHIFPGLATGRVLRERGHDVTLWMAGKDVEQAAVKGWEGPIITVRSEGFVSGLSWRTLRTVFQLVRASRSCHEQMAAAKPDVLLAMGSYASIGPATAAFRLRVPVVLHEANVIPGRAVAVLSGRATAVAAVFEETRFHLRRREIVLTGMPLRREVIAARTLEIPRPSPPRFTVLVTGGSRGARALNRIVLEAFENLACLRDELFVIHLTGAADEAAAREVYRRVGIPHEVYAFHHDMGVCYRRADLAICRAGAATCAELLIYGLPALLVPFPYAARKHQTANARAVAKHGAADVIEERDLESDWLAEYLAGMKRTPARLSRMRVAALQRGRIDAAEALADLVEKSARGSAIPSV